MISRDTIWSGAVTVAEDVLILPGATLTVQAGTTITIMPSGSTQTQPEFFSPLTEITVRGSLVVNGSPAQPVRLGMISGGAEEQEWAGIYVDGGRLQLSHATIQDADSAVTVMAGAATLNDSVLSNNRHGLTVMRGGQAVTATATIFAENDYGIVLLNGATVERRDCELRDNRKQDLHQRDLRGYQPESRSYQGGAGRNESVYSSESLLGTVIWRDKIIVNGIVRVPPRSRLIIMPGTVIEFSRNDTNDDGIGENGLLIMGMLVAKGTEAQPIIFRSAEKNRQRGDWDSINIYASDGFQNLIEHCLIEDAYRAVHLHFSNVVVNGSVLRHNYRGLQFQESLVAVTGTDIHDNKSAMRARDSEIVFTHNRIYDNYLGPYLYRITGRFGNNRVTANYLDGLRIREGALTVAENYLAGNKYGLSVSYAVFGNFSSNVMTDNVESGIALKGTDRIDVTGNFIQGNGGNGISLLHSQAVIKGNHLAANGERGIGINFFNGVITENNLLDNQLYAIGLESGEDVAAPGNWFGGGEPGLVIFDKADDPAKGALAYGPVRREPVPFTWPLATIEDDTVWDGEFVVPVRVTLPAGVNLRIVPGSKVRFAKGRGFWVNGQLEASGEPGRRILFTRQADSREAGDEDNWHQVMVEDGKAVLINCDFEFANIGLHSHFSNIQILSSTFRHNKNGVMFQGGPVKISQSLFVDNDFAIVPNLAVGLITENEIYRNKVGILVRDEKEGLVLFRFNNIHDNSRNNLQMGEFNVGDIDVINNWWGQGAPAERIFDAGDEPGIGRAIYEPYAREPYRVNVNQ